MPHHSRFSLFQTPIDLAHQYWQAAVKPGDMVIDATCGNGHDALILASLALEEDKGCLIAIDKQPEAIAFTKERLRARISAELFARVRFEEKCHSRFPEDLEKETATLAVYNLGYLPGGDKSRTTMCATTMQSIDAVLTLIRPGGLISITCYPGHPEGKREEDQIIEFASNLNPGMWSCCLHRWCNRKASPSLLICQKALRS